MGLLDQAKADILQITSNPNEFGVSMIFVAPNAATVTVVGLHTKHHMAVDTDGNLINSKNAHLSVAEKQFTDAGYVVRNSAGEVNLKGHKVTVKDSTGIAKNYVVREVFPNETIGLLTCILGALA